MKSPKIWYFVIGIVVAIVLIIVATRSPSTKAGVVKVGAPFILSGDAAKYGETAKNAVELALAKYNSDPDVTSGKKPKIEVVYEDTREDAKTAVTVYHKLLDVDHVSALIGPLFVQEMSAVAPLVRHDKIPMFAMSPVPVSDRVVESNPLIIWSNPTLESEQLAQYVYNQGVRKVAILGTNDPWESEVSNGFNAGFSKAGGTITDVEINQVDSKDPSISVTKALASKPEAVYLGTYLKFEYYIKKLRNLGFKGKVYSIENDNYLADVTKPYSDGVEFISPAYFTPEFAKAYTDAYKEAPSIPAGQAYDSFNLFALMVNKSNWNDSKVFQTDMLKQMDALTSYDGVSGHITFDSNHVASFPLSIFTIQDGKISPKK